MPTPATESSWDFQPVFDLLHAEADPVKNGSLDDLQHSISHTRDPDHGSYIVRLAEELAEVSKEVVERTRTQETHTLGDFSRLWTQLGLEPNLPPPAISPIEPIVEELPSSADEGLLSSPPDNPDGVITAPSHSDNVLPTKSGSATDIGQEGDDEFAGLSKGQRKRARKAARRAEKERTRARIDEKGEDRRRRLEQFKIRQRMEKGLQLEALHSAATNPRALDLAPIQILARQVKDIPTPPIDALAGIEPQEPHKHTPDIGNTIQANNGAPRILPRPSSTSNAQIKPKTPARVPMVPDHLQLPMELPTQSTPDVFTAFNTMQPPHHSNIPKTDDVQTPIQNRGNAAVEPHAFFAINLAPQANSFTASSSHEELVPAQLANNQQRSQPPPFSFKAGADSLPPFPGVTSVPATQAPLQTIPAPQLIPRTVQPLAPRPSTPGAVSNPANQSYFPSVAPTQLVPRTVQVPAPRTPVPAPKGGFIIRPVLERHLNLLHQLLLIFPEDQKWLVAPMQLLNNKLSAGAGIHIFVDASNILIGFRDKLKYARTPMYDLSFDSLALLLERRRPVARRVLAGSSRKTSPLPFVNVLIAKAEEVGYENNVYEQVYKEKELTDRQRFFKDVDRIGYKAALALRSSGESSDSETGAAALTPGAPSPMKWVEQGVDENLHLKMCQSILDADEPATMVLATGDGAAAEYSDGFLAHVERALKRGWTVELVSWKQQINSGYLKKKWQAKWGAKFKVIYLDDFVESLVET